MRKFAAGFLVGLSIAYILILLIATVGDCHSTSHFYVKSVSEGYKACIDHGKVTVCLGRPLNDPTDANIIVKELNRDMEGNWEK